VKDWLASLATGDKVIVTDGWNTQRIAIVDKVTPTQVVVGNARYRRHSGKMVGADSYSRNCIHEATPALLADVRKKTLAIKLAEFKWHDYSLIDLEAVWKVVRAMKPPTTGEKP
jgi:hypothetical protein